MPISVMLKPASGNCNLRCEYCFYHDLAATRQTENKVCRVSARSW